MTQNIDYDTYLARRLDARLASFVPLGRIAAPAARTSAWRLAGAGALAAVTLTAAGVGLGANAYADAQGLSCADAMTKVQLFAASLADQVRGASIDEQRAAKQRVLDYAVPIINGSCEGQMVKNPDGTVGWQPHPSPSGAVAPAQPQGTFDPSRTPKPTNPLPSPTGRP